MARQQTRPKTNRGGGKAGRPRMTTGATIVGVVVVAAAIAWFAYQAAANKPGEQFPDLGNEHIQTATDPHEAYNSDPPTSGPHLPYIAPWGIHTRPIRSEEHTSELQSR